MIEGHFHRHLEAALAAVGAEVPDLYQASASAFGARVVVAEVDDERLAVVRDERGLRVLADAARPTVFARTSHRAICEVLAGRYTILEALWTDALELRGGVDDLLALDHALRLFLQGAVRAPSFPGILVSFRGSVRIS